MKQRPAKGAPADSCWRPRARTPCCSSTFGLPLLPRPLSSELPFLEKLRSLLRKHVTIPQPRNVKQTDIVFPNGITVTSGLHLPGGDRLPLVPGDPSLLHGLTQESRGFGGTRTLGRGLGCSPGQSLWLLLIPEHVPTSGTSEMHPHWVFLRGHRHTQGSPQPRPAPSLGTLSASPGPVRCLRAVRPSHWRSPKARAPPARRGQAQWIPLPPGQPLPEAQRLSSRPQGRPPPCSSLPPRSWPGTQRPVSPPGWGREHAPHFAPCVFQSHPAHLQPKMPQRRPRGSGERVLRLVQTTAPGHSPHLRIDKGQEDPAAPTLLTQKKTRLRISFPELGLRGPCHLICSDPTSCPTQAPMFPACTHRPASPSAPASTVCSQVTQHPNGPGASTPASPDTHLQTT
nr:nascent polypeptide-associated complex subunit alpha, muscle-specific form-like [Equus asinus]